MKKIFKPITLPLIPVLGALTVCMWFFHSAPAADKPPASRDALLRIRLPVPKDQGERRYLGVSGDGHFEISRIRADTVIIEIFSLYCPQCQASAPEVNALYQMIEQVPDFKDRIKMIGIGAGNNVLEADTFKTQYKIPFPVFPDPDFKIHKDLGEVRTPYFIVVKIKKDRILEIFLLQEGAFGEAETFLQQVLKASELKELLSNPR